MNIEKVLHRSGILYQVQKPSRYIGHEWNRTKKPVDKALTRFLLVFPDLYEIGMSHLGLRILYDVINRTPGMMAERAFLPWVDMQRKITDGTIPLYSLESFSTIDEFDAIGFTLQYELSYPGIIRFLDLAKLSPFSLDRKDEDPILIAGGPCAYNPEPLAEILDAFFIGDAEEGIVEIGECLRANKGERKPKRLSELAKIPGVYVPRFPPAAPVRKRIVPKEALNCIQDWMVPFFPIVHERAILETQRGCTRGCRFCQAGMIYRPVRESPLETLARMVVKRTEETGYEEMALLSLSTLDYSQLSELIARSRAFLDEKMVALSIPSSRMDQFSLQIANQISGVRKSGLTFAPEAGTQRMRNVINKNLSEEEILTTVLTAKNGGWTRLKLYFMVGLPTETAEDIEGIVTLTKKIKEVGIKKISVSVAGFVPKPHTPFQYCAQKTVDELHRILHALLNIKGVASFELHKPEMSWVEGVLARGDRKLGPSLVQVSRQGNGFEGLQEEFSYERWGSAWLDTGIDPDRYTAQRGTEEAFPWDVVDAGLTKAFLKSEYEKALRAESTPDCRDGACSQCGVCLP
ncbi:MAG TPA: radical SAM protein [Thermotogota bacterium]|nr:radical SAM protein [Thermotogota bacterium]